MTATWMLLGCSSGTIPPSQTSAPVQHQEPCSLRATLSQKDGAHRRPVLTLINEGKRPLRLALPTDGSEFEARTPLLTWSATLNGEPVKPLPVGVCGTLAPHERTFVLAPGERRAIDNLPSVPQYPSGTYEVKLRYEHDPKLVGGPDRPGQFVGTDECRATTNAVTMTFSDS